jgi:hydrogenase nickel incorporation protein HypA/HybF
VHELGITQEIVAIAAEHSRGARVARVIVEIGRFTAVLPDAVRFCFDLCSEGTAVEGATLVIVEVPGRGSCRRCGLEQLFDQPVGLCSCGSMDIEWTGGDELRVQRVEVS